MSDETPSLANPPALPTTLPAGALERLGIPADPTLHDEVQAILAKVEPGHLDARLRLTLSSDMVAGAYLVAAERTASGWELTQAFGLQASLRTREWSARVELEFSK